MKYTFKDILGIVFFGVLAGNDEWGDIYDYVVDEKETLRDYLDKRWQKWQGSTLIKICIKTKNWIVMYTTLLRQMEGVLGESYNNGEAVGVQYEFEG